MTPWIYDIVLTLARWLHVVCMTLVVGGTLFYELVLPISLEDLKKEQQLYAFARARLVFRWVVWISVVGLLLSGAVSMYRIWGAYRPAETDFAWVVRRWAIWHTVLGAASMVIALLLTIGRRPPEHPVRWMRFNLVILLIVIFLGSATRHFQLALLEGPRAAGGKAPPDGVPPVVDTRPVSPDGSGE